MITLPILRNQDEIQQLQGMIEPCGYIAGGYARYVCSPNKVVASPDDIDIYSSTPINYQLLDANIASYDLKLAYETDLSKTYWFNDKFLSLIKPNVYKHMQAYGTPNSIIRQFDFTVCQVYIGHGQCYAVDSFLEDEQYKQIVIFNVQSKLGTLKRIQKYIQKGYRLSESQMMKYIRYCEAENVEVNRKIPT